RDTPPRSAAQHVARIEAWMQQLGTGRIATVVGRYWAMDRDHRWERVQRAWDALVGGLGLQAETAQQAIAAAYARGEGDEFVQPTIVGARTAGRVRTGDAVFFCNFRADRARQLTEAFLAPEFAGFPRPQRPDVHFATMTRYREDFGCPVAFAPQN